MYYILDGSRLAAVAEEGRLTHCEQLISSDYTKMFSSSHFRHLVYSQHRSKIKYTEVSFHKRAGKKDDNKEIHTLSEAHESPGP